MKYEKRFDGRKPDEMRSVEIKTGVLDNADGSCLFKIGGTRVIAGVFGPRTLMPKHVQDPNEAVLSCNYDLMSFSVPDRARPGPNRRSTELSLVIAEALKPLVFTEQFPRAGIDVFVEVLEADAGTRCAAITAASLALADAGIPMKGFIGSVACGKIGDKVVLDLTKEEEDFEGGATDIAVAYSPVNNELTLLQLDGEISKTDFEEAVKLAMKGCTELVELQKKALKEKYAEE